MASSTANKIWFITGASSGLGLSTGLAALKAGHRVVGTGRNIEKAAAQNPDFEKLGGRWVQLDVCQSSTQQTIEKVIEEEEERLGQTGPIHWVVVNNAGAAAIGAVEQASDKFISDYFEANVFGVMRVWKATIPTLRRHRTGTLITLSSYMSVLNKPEQMLYCSVKATTSSLAESYADLLGPLGIRSMIIEPGGFRTSFVGNIARVDGPAPDEYKERIQKWVELVEMVAKNPSLIKGDPERFGPAVVDAVEGRGLFKSIWEEQQLEKALHIPFGSDSYGIMDHKYKELSAGISKMTEIAKLSDAQE